MSAVNQTPSVAGTLHRAVAIGSVVSVKVCIQAPAISKVSVR